jgi:hypothetical protein
MKFVHIFCVVIGAYGWGQDGHKTVAAVAESLLSVPAREAITGLLLPWESMASVATWADEVGHTPEYDWTRCMHFVDTEGCSLSGNTDCGCCVINAIGNYTRRVADRSLSSSERNEALKFLIHFVGDASQPLHAGHTEDRGGNLVHVTVGWSGHTSTTSNLHSVWDSIMIEHMLHMQSWNFHTFATNIVSKIRENSFPIAEWEKGCDGSVDETCPVEASGESAQLACEYAYTDETGKTIISGSVLSKEYFETRIPVVEERLAAAGVRLASILNGLFGSNILSKFPEVKVT